MKQLFFMGILCSALTSSAQTNPESDFLYLYNDSVVYADWVTLGSSGIFGGFNF